MWSIGDSIIVGLIILGNIAGSKWDHGIAYLVTFMCLLKYGVIDLRRYKQGLSGAGVLGAELRLLEKIGGKGFALGFVSMMLSLMLIVLIVVMVFEIIHTRLA